MKDIQFIYTNYLVKGSPNFFVGGPRWLRQIGVEGQILKEWFKINIVTCCVLKKCSSYKRAK
jgi:hypothetical protein